MRMVLAAGSLMILLIHIQLSFGQQSAVQALTPATTIEKKLMDLLQESHGPEEMQVKLETVPAHLKQPVRIKSVNVHRMPEVEGKGLALVTFEGDDGKPRTSYIPFRVYEKKTLYYAKRSLPKGSVVEAEDLAIKETYISENDLIYPGGLRELSGKVLRRDVSAGMVITNPMLDNPQVIRRGETVSLVIDNKQLLVKTKGKAQDPGKVGEKIRVKNLTSDRELVGRVAGEGTVVIEF